MLPGKLKRLPIFLLIFLLSIKISFFYSWADNLERDEEEIKEENRKRLERAKTWE